MSTTPNPYDSAVEVAHIRAGHIHDDVATAAMDYYRPMTNAEMSELVAAVVRIFVDVNTSEIWLTANEVLTLCATHSHD